MSWLEALLILIAIAALVSFVGTVYLAVRVFKFLWRMDAGTEVRIIKG